jgi:chlorite dismutase
MPFHSYIFFDAEPSIHSLPAGKLASAKAKFATVAARGKNTRIQSYSTLGFKAGTRFALNINAVSPEAIQALVSDLLHTGLGKHLKLPYTLFGMTRSSQYSPNRPPKEADWNLPHRYLVVYPFTKTIEWHLMPYEKRREIMKAHVDVGRKHSEKISQRLLYAYGVDDHEFIVSYQMDDLEAFQTLVMEMRETESRCHTKNDLPIFTCIHMPLKEALNTI